MYAEKLDLHIDTATLANITITAKKEYARLLKRTAGTYTGTLASFTSFHFEVPDDLYTGLPPALLAVERPTVCILETPPAPTHDSVVPPHIDYRRRCGINFYLEASGEKTQYYSEDYTQVIQEFEAKQGECWLLNSEVPHGVLLVKNKSRKILSFSFARLTYGEVQRYVNQTI